jgi:ssDNA-binding Zn-finger/Zn-ribbon topoisomerase 1
VAKTIRELGEKLPSIRENDEAKRQFRLGGRIHTLEQHPRTCPRGHLMVIRTGKSGEFWGCSQFRLCWKTAQLAQLAQLTSAQGDLLHL